MGEVSEMRKFEKGKRKGTIMGKRIVLIAIMLVMTVLVVTGCADDQYVKAVKNSSLDMAPNIKIGQAFDKFFPDGEWKSLETKDHKHVVQFDGSCQLNNVDAHMIIQFLIHNDGSFETYAMTINGISQNPFDMSIYLMHILTGN